MIMISFEEYIQKIMMINKKIQREDFGGDKYIENIKVTIQIK